MWNCSGKSGINMIEFKNISKMYKVAVREGGIKNAMKSLFTRNYKIFLNVFTYGARQFGRYPFSIYGKGILRFLTFVIPLALFQYYPLLYITDRNKSSYLVIFPIFSLLFILPSYGFFRMGLRRYQSTGS